MLDKLVHKVDELYSLVNGISEWPEGEENAYKERLRKILGYYHTIEQDPSEATRDPLKDLGTPYFVWLDKTVHKHVSAPSSVPTKIFNTPGFRVKPPILKQYSNLISARASSQLQDVPINDSKKAGKAKAKHDYDDARQAKKVKQGARSSKTRSDLSPVPEEKASQPAKPSKKPNTSAANTQSYDKPQGAKSHPPKAKKPLEFKSDPSTLPSSRKRPKVPEPDGSHSQEETDRRPAKKSKVPPHDQPPVQTSTKLPTALPQPRLNAQLQHQATPQPDEQDPEQLDSEVSDTEGQRVAQRAASTSRSESPTLPIRLPSNEDLPTGNVSADLASLVQLVLAQTSRLNEIEGDHRVLMDNASNHTTSVNNGIPAFVTQELLDLRSQVSDLQRRNTALETDLRKLKTALESTVTQASNFDTFILPNASNDWTQYLAPSDQSTTSEVAPHINSVSNVSS
ncbi:hypothetical protein CC2G_005135 [Coprinopsis cinerea AmutBmut pab1-1]|nr:hypothetical protein CC2G_005135 [Coprinopsis cinerea AmutBmut pab1-1]